MPRRAFNDITGKKFGRLTALRFIPDDSKFSKFWCVCECGNEKSVMAQALISGLTVSCGCFKNEQIKKRATAHGYGKSGKERSPTYSSWASMMDRCEWGGHKIMYAKYGAKGIRVCPEWHNFENFLRDMGVRPPGTSIDRKENSDGYSKNNCRWATRREQALNTTRTAKVLIDGKPVIVFELCEKLGLSRKAVRARASRRGNDYVAALKSIGIECEPVFKDGQYKKWPAETTARLTDMAEMMVSET